MVIYESIYVDLVKSAALRKKGSSDPSGLNADGMDGGEFWLAAVMAQEILKIFLIVIKKDLHQEDSNKCWNQQNTTRINFSM